MRKKIERIDSDNGKFKDGDPLSGEYGTIVKAKWLNDVQEALRTNQGEILNVLREAGIEPKEADETQLWQALQVISGQVESIAALREFEPVRDRQVVFVKGYYAGSNKGGGYFVADFADGKTADDGWKVIITAKGKRWKAVEKIEKSLNNKRVKLDIPLIFDGYESELAKVNLTDESGYIYPGSFAIDERENELIILYGGSWSNAPMYLVARDFDTGDQKWWCKLNTTSIGEGISINYDYGSRKAFVAGRQNGYLYSFDLTNVANGTTLEVASSHEVGIYNQFSYDNGVWAIERNAPFVAGYIARNTIDFYDKNFNLLNSVSLPIWSSGYVTKTINSYAPYLNKRQGFALHKDKLYCAFGGAHDNNTPAVCTEYQGLKIYNLSGDCLDECLLDPIKMRKILTSHLGKSDLLKRIENEGIVVTPNGNVYTLFIYHSRATPFETRKQEGIVIYQELTDAGDCVDYAEAITYTAKPNLDFRRMPRGPSGKMIDQLTGREITQMSEIFNYMLELNIPDLMFDTGGFTNITDIDGTKLRSGLFVRVINQNTIMYVDITKRDHAAAYTVPSSYAATWSSSGVWTKNKYDLSVGGDLVFGKDSDGVSSVLARLSAKNFIKGKNILLADVQSTGTTNKAFLGGGSSVYEGVNEIRFYTAESKGEAGTARWMIDSAGGLSPFTTGTYDIGSTSKRVKGVYTQDVSIAKTDETSAIIRLANSLREITLNIAQSGNAGLWDNNLKKWLLLANSDGILTTGTAPSTSATGSELITANWFNAQFTQSLTKNGWQKLPSGLIIQWGTYNSDNGSDFSFPIAFNSVLFAIPGDVNTSGSYVANVTLTNISNTGFSVLRSGDLGAFSVFAIGV